MKTFKPRMIQEYQCDFCTRRYLNKTKGLQHENKCYLNPNRNCNGCNNTGVETCEGIHAPEFGIEKEGYSQPCSSCKIAASAGGKSYLK